ncbi:MAG: NADH-quinone oxidoreductase subunit N [Bdellovibrionales bacterium]|nr:NADH-quinone oxidoreductase subunit N [Bdellovibrionales bacterium]
MPIEINLKIQDFICVAPAALLFLWSLVPLTFKVVRGNKELNSMAALLLTLVGVVCSVAASGLLYAQQSEPYFAFSNALVFDGVSVLSAIVIAIITAAAAIMAREHKATNGEHFSEFLFLLMNAAVGMMILSWANDLIVTFIAIEIMSLCLYLLIALSKEGALSKEAAFKYFVLGSFASAIFLYGIAFIYGITGTTYLNVIAKSAPTLIAGNYLFMFGVLLAVLGFCFKAAIVPFHAWTPDVYEGSPIPVTAFMAAGVKFVVFVAFLRFIRGNYLSFDVSGEFITVLQWLAVLTMCLGNIAAIVQSSLKRMLAYSSIAHGGFVLIGVIAAAIGGESWRGDLSVLYYVVSYTVMTIGAFGIVCMLEKNEGDIILVEDLRGLAKRSQITALIFTIFMLSLAGIPPLVGFFAKFFIFSAALKQGLFWLVIWAAINSVIAAYYYLRPIVMMYMSDDAGVDVAEQYKMTRTLTTVMAMLVVLLGFATEPFYQHIRHAISSLF